MPLDQVFVGLLRNRSWVNILLMRSLNLYQLNTLDRNPTEVIEVSTNGFSWNEQNLEYRVELDKFFEIGVKTDEGEPLFAQGEMQANNVIFGAALRRLNHRMMAPEIELGELRIHIKPSISCSIHCSNCSNEVITSRDFAQVKPVPITTMKPQNYFCGRCKVPIYPREDQLFYGLNYLVVNPKVIGPGVTYTRGQRRLQCSRCLQCLGDVLGLDVAVQLHADALRVLQWDKDKPIQFAEIFGHVTVTQLMLRLLHDAEPVNLEKTRIFLRALRPDGQLQYLQLLVDKRQVQLLRSPLAPENESLPRRRVASETESSSESDFDISSSDRSNPAFSPTPGDEEIVRPVAKRKIVRERPVKVVKYVGIRGYRACRLKYLFSGNDRELSDNHELILQWREEGCRLLRVSYSMMAEILAELNANEHIVAALEKLPPPVKTDQPRLSYIIYETDDEFYGKQKKGFFHKPQLKIEMI
ncbi:uncharacterized protein Dana_GF26877, isoform B [Drosophila ananassae]|uniref:Uncharacterized protein, isoform B n=1 Tax=Drosophila ananassae TaxID=7217 RepID=A0A0N8P1B4_DROAN|nr:uncharacterized protein Dana_GF26877, isoform B [Drosophila ananassae]